MLPNDLRPGQVRQFLKSAYDIYGDLKFSEGDKLIIHSITETSSSTRVTYLNGKGEPGSVDLAKFLEFTAPI